MTDLIVALAAGAAGAFALSRDDVADSLPGVAIAIALVPPLCVVGISLGDQQWADAWGAFLLFLTNCLSILLAGGAVFGIMGLHKAGTEEMTDVNRRKAYTIIAIGIILVSIPLAATTFKVGRDSIAQYQITKIADAWVEQFEENYVVSSVLVSDSVARVVVTGPQVPDDAPELGDQIQNEIKQVKTVRLIFVPSKEYDYERQASD